MRGTARTVFHGTQSEEFNVEILGVMPNWIGPKQDMIVGRLSGANAERTFVFAGMSGSPVIVRSRGASPMADGSVAVMGTATRVVGVYSGRLSTNYPLDAQLGMVWPIRLVDEIINGASRDVGMMS